MKNNRVLFYCSTLEVCYLGLSFILSEIYGQWSLSGELIRTGLRLLVIACYVYCYRRYFINSQPTMSEKPKFSPLFLAAVCGLLLLAAVNTNAENETVMWQLVFAVSGLTAGLREELFYRGMVQQQFQVHHGVKIALPSASAIFTLSHVQYLYHSQWHGLLLITLAGVIFGSIFIYTKSIVLTSLIHGAYDAMLSIKICPVKINYSTAFIGLFLIMLVFLMLVNRHLKNNVKLDFDDRNPA